MTRKEIIKKAIENKEIELDTAGLIKPNRKENKG